MQIKIAFLFALEDGVKEQKNLMSNGKVTYKTREEDPDVNDDDLCEMTEGYLVCREWCR